MEAEPDVSVVVGAYNAMPYLTRCVSSVLEQSMGVDRLELLAVNDGSSDGTGEELERFAASSPAVRVIHQKNSGGPAGPRNVGIENARGRYIFFLDADDYLGAEALERMVAMADRNESDIVVGRRVGVGGRGVPTSVFDRNQDDADLFSSGLWRILSAQKLFRRSLIDRLGLRFPDLPVGQDQPFTAQAYLNAGTISILADYECYYLVRRDDGGNNTLRHRDVGVWLRFVETMMKLVADAVPAGQKRDALMSRHFADELRRVCLGRRLIEANPELQADVMSRAKTLVESYYSPRIAADMPVDGRVRLYLVTHGLLEELLSFIQQYRPGKYRREMLENGRVYAPIPYFRDKAVGVPDSCYDVTEHRLPLAKVNWSPGRELAVEFVTPKDPAGFSIVLTGPAGNVHRPDCRFVDPASEDKAYRVIMALGSATGGGPLGYGEWTIVAEHAVPAHGRIRSVTNQRRTISARLWWRGRIPSLAILRTADQRLRIVSLPLFSIASAKVLWSAVRRRLRR